MLAFHIVYTSDKKSYAFSDIKKITSLIINYLYYFVPKGGFAPLNWSYQLWEIPLFQKRGEPCRLGVFSLILHLNLELISDIFNPLLNNPQISTLLIYF